jgi:putative FmdB family regulatory protein
MPTYEYACTECGEHLEVVQSFTDDALTVCPSCEGKLRKVFQPVGVVFKGSGFYKTDSRAKTSNGSADSAKSTESSSDSSTGSSSNGSGDSGTSKPADSSGSTSSDSGSKSESKSASKSSSESTSGSGGKSSPARSGSKGGGSKVA